MKRKQRLSIVLLLSLLHGCYAFSQNNQAEVQLKEMLPEAQDMPATCHLVNADNMPFLQDLQPLIKSNPFVSSQPKFIQAFFHSMQEFSVSQQVVAHTQALAIAMYAPVDAPRNETGFVGFALESASAKDELVHTLQRIIDKNPDAPIAILVKHNLVFLLYKDRADEPCFDAFKTSITTNLESLTD